MFKWSEGHQLFINTFTTVVTYLMVFIIQNSTNRAAKESEIKMNELIRSIGSARNKMIDLSGFSDKDLEKLEKEIKACRTRKS